MAPQTPIQIFKPGRHVAMSGAALEFSESDLVACAAAYDPAKHEAPIVVGHPRTDGPAYGWVKSLAFADGLEAEPHQVDPAFAEMVSAGRFKHVSASFYAPDSPANPVPGAYYLRHVGFLGAQPPSVKGLRAPQFAEGEAGVVEFSDYDDQVNASLWRRMREWIISRFGLDEADKTIPDDQLATLDRYAAQESDETATSPSYADPIHHQETLVTPEQKAALEAENQRLAGEVAAMKATQAEAAATAIRAEGTQFCEGLIKAGKLLPAEKDAALALYGLAAASAPIEFGEGDGKASAPPLEKFKALLSAMPKRVEFGEVAAGQILGSGTVSFAAPDRYQVDQSALEVHQSALAYQAAHPAVDYVTAVKTVQTGA